VKILTQWLREYLPGLTVSDRELADDLTLRGIAVEGVFDLGDANGSLYETDITTNRVDAMNHYGVAREAAAIYGLTLAPLDSHVSEARHGSPSAAASAFRISIEAPDLCGRFTARVLRDVTIRPSTGIVARRFALLEQKQIFNAVDASNYVMLAMGQPTHAFDLDKLEGGIVVRRARKGERLKLLDGSERALDTDDLVVADEKKALGLAGVMGGWDSMITAETKNVLVEAAWFDPNAVRRSSRRHGLHTDASHRYERGADFNAAPIASAMVTNMILEAGGHVEGEFVDVIVPAAQARTASRSPISLDISEVQRLLGATEDGKGVDAAATEQLLTALGCSLASTRDDSYQVTLPSWRLDLEREIDLIEEVARVYGYNRFANTLPTFSGTVIELAHATHESVVRTLMLACGFNEAVTSTFCAAADAEFYAPQPGTTVAMGNPLSAEAGVLRPSIVPGLVTAAENNLNRNVSDVRLFETGTTFSGSTERVDEKPALGFIVTGNVPVTGPHHAPRSFDFYDAKGVVEALISKFQHRANYVDALLLPAWLHPGRGARVVLDGLTVGYFGQLHPAEALKRKMKQEVLLGELYLDRLFQLPLRQPRVEELSRFQSVARDFSIVFPDGVRWEQIAEALQTLDISELIRYAPQELFRTNKRAENNIVDEGNYSLLLSTVFQASDRTLREEEVQGWSHRVVSALEALGGRLRS
jgi:phenylalanyl-tRNA synthetase beta chain